MAIPVIFETISVLCFKQGQTFHFQPAASNSPTSWTALGLPNGVSIDSTTGLISGESLGIGVYDVTLRASNASGSSADFVFPLILLEANGAMDEAVELDVDLSTGEVSGFGKPVLFAKSGDKMLLSIGFKKGNDYQTFLLNELSFCLKEFEPESAVVLSDGDYLPSRSGFRYLILVEFSGSKMRSSLSNYESDAGTFYDGFGEIRWAWERPGLAGDTLSLERASATFGVRIERSLAA